jgi:hypothetical protein
LHRLISFVTQSEHIHVGIAFWADFGNQRHLMMSEANGGAQRRILNLSHYQDHDMDVLSSKHSWDEISDKALIHLGQVQYSFLEAGYVGINEVFEHLFGVSLPHVDFPGEICSEFVATVLSLKRKYLSPAKLFKYMTKSLKYDVRVKIRDKKSRF